MKTHIGFVVKNAEDMCRFYTDLLGFSEIKRFTKPDWEGEAILLALADFSLEFFCWDDPEGSLSPGRNRKKLGFNHLGIEVGNVESVHERMKLAGVTVTKPKKGTTCVMYFFAEDPDGNSIELYQK